MTEITLVEFVNKYGQVDAARRLGMAQSSLSAAVRSGRKIFVLENGNGTCEAREVKAFPSADFIRTPKTKKKKRA